MQPELKLSKTLTQRLERIAAVVHLNPEFILKTALEDRLNYLEWKEQAIADGQADLDKGNVVSTEQIRASLAKQRATRNQKAA